MWKLGRGRVLLDEPPEEEDGLRGGPPPAASAAQAQVQGASFRGWKEVTSMFNKDDEQHLLERCKSPKSKGTNLRLKEELKAEKKSGFWDNLVLKQNIQSKKPDEIEGWEPPKLALEDISADPEDTVGGHPSWSGWEDDTKGSTKYTSLASSANSSRWSLRSAGRLGCVVAPLLQAESQGCGPPPGTGTCCTPSQIQKRGHSNENAGRYMYLATRRASFLLMCRALLQSYCTQSTVTIYFWLD
ncbi:testis development-related protein isoform X2 [Hylobates moloch]|uniref:testis development-related protein isoform X2 n=1 Tax=Hylobates moloch TaxID=81572 RepID=UPI0026746FAE|nr:testis development-related protein isoform X2 [Hylobates moloch]